MNLVFKHKPLLRALSSDTVQLLFVLLAGTGGDSKKRGREATREARGRSWGSVVVDLVRASPEGCLGHAGL